MSYSGPTQSVTTVFLWKTVLMKFSEQMEANMTPEWKTQYLCYGMLKSVLLAGVGEVTEKDVTISQMHLKSVQDVFFQMCDRELAKVNHFYIEKLSEAQRKLISVRVAVGAFLAEQQRSESCGSQWKLRWILHKVRVSRGQQNKQKLKLAVRELYLSFTLLQNYEELNYMGFCKIIKKHDDRFTSAKGTNWKNERLDQSGIQSGGSANQFISELESLMCHLEEGNRQKAMESLEQPPMKAAKTVPVWTTFRLGVTCGLLLSLLLLIVLQVTKAPELAVLKPLLRLYRGGFLLIELLFLLGINIYGWKMAGINYVLIFELDYQDHLSHHQVFEVAGYLAVCWCASMLACLHSPHLPIPLQLHPLLFYLLPVLLLLNPTPTFHPQARQWLRSLLCRVFSAPLHPVAFADAWLADQLNSLSPLFLDLWSVTCFYACEVDWSDPPSLNTPPVGNLDCVSYARHLSCLIQCFPPWLRFAQCLRNFWDCGEMMPHLLNAGKYATVFLTVTFAGLYSISSDNPNQEPVVKIYLYLWAAATCFSVLATVSWDLKMDWGLLETPSFLKEEMVYPRQAYYYCAMLADVLLRVSWGINIILVQMRDSSFLALTGILAPLEVLRRFIWNFFKVENEHVSNCNQFRAVRDFPLTASVLNGHYILDQDFTRDDLEQNSTQHAKPYSVFKWISFRNKDQEGYLTSEDAEKTFPFSV